MKGGEFVVYVLHGSSHRIQIRVQSQDPRIWMRRLSAHQSPYTPFWRGELIYVGSDGFDALSVLADYVPKSERIIPQRLWDLLFQNA
jgi:hypothetical protein